MERIRKSDVVTAKQVVAYKCLRMAECPAAYLWGVVDWGIELGQLLVVNYTAYKYVPIIQCNEIDWHISSAQSRPAVDTFLVAREARNGGGYGNDRVV
jgi:hypothetical protein